MAVTVRDRGYNRLMRAAREAKVGGLSVGIHPREGRERHPSGMTVSEIARLHETGTRTMPARPFLSRWYDGGGRKMIRDTVRRALARSLKSGRPPWRELEGAGERYVRQIRATFRLMAPLAPSTVRAKRSSRQLVETGLLSGAIGHRVTRGSRA